jgi:hypothetical protein
LFELESEIHKGARIVLFENLFDEPAFTVIAGVVEELEEMIVLFANVMLFPESISTERAEFAELELAFIMLFANT